MQEVDRTRRVGELLRRELSTLISREMDDQRVAMTSITGVKVSKDLRQATVYVSSVQDGDLDHKALEQGLNHAAGYLRHLLSQNLDLRRTPALHFVYDDTIQHGVELTHLIDSLNKD
ncbi:MAG: 30S ribosome-binding factor RbfA [Pseudomonadota bacterium]|nr:30S ribosome-binding factor RbfA [Pseudomonadota bacterium]